MERELANSGLAHAPPGRSCRSVSPNLGMSSSRTCGQRRSDLQSSGNSTSGTNEENGSQTGTGMHSATDTAPSVTGTNGSADASSDGSANASSDDSADANCDASADGGNNDTMSMDGEGKSSSSSDNEDFPVLRKTVHSSLNTVTVPAVVAAITPVSIYKSATAPLLDGTGTVSSPVIDRITVSSITSGKMEETSSAGAAASHLAGSHPKVSVSLASIPAISVQDQIGATTTFVSGPAVFDNNDLCAKDLSDQGTFFIYFNCTFLNSFNNILDVRMNSPPSPNQLELQGASRTTGGIF